MYVCLCKAVTEEELRSLADSFGPDLDCLQRTCGVATDCGTCLRKVEGILDDCAQNRECAVAASGR